MKRRLILALSLISLATAALGAPSGVAVSLSIAQAKTLPGLSVPLTIRVTNAGPAFQLAPSVAVRLTPPDGAPYIAEWGEPNARVGDLELGTEDGDSLAVSAKETVDLEVPAVDFSRPSWALDPQFISRPGVWKVEVVLYESRGEDDSAELAVSNPATLTVATPGAGDDEIWDALRTREEWGIAEKVFLTKQDSAYFPYLAALVRRESSLEKVAILERAMQLHPNAPVAPWLRYAVASYYGIESQRVFDVERDLEKAVGLADKGRTELTKLSNGAGQWSKRAAKVKLGEHPSREYFTDLQRQRTK
jgi:hypothetical protein